MQSLSAMQLQMRLNNEWGLYSLQETDCYGVLTRTEWWNYWMPMQEFRFIQGLLSELDTQGLVLESPRLQGIQEPVWDASFICKITLGTKLNSTKHLFFPRCPTCDEQTRMHPRTYKADEIDNMLLRELRKVESSHVPKSTSSPKDIYWHHMLAFFKADSSWWMGRRQCFVLWEEPVTLDLLYRQGSFR